MYRISVTSLEKFRRVRDKVSIYDTEKSLIDNLSGTFKGNDYTYIGSAFHKIIETGCANYIGNGIFEQVSDEAKVKLNYDAVENAIYYRNQFPDAKHEIHAGKDFKTPYFPIHVHGYADLVDGNIVRDVKTKYSIPHEKDYKDSCQWTFYLEMFNCSMFYFDLFQFDGYKKIMKTDVSKTNLIVYNPIQCIRTNKLEEYNQMLLNEFCQYIENNNLYHLLKLKEDLEE